MVNDQCKWMVTLRYQLECSINIREVVIYSSLDTMDPRWKHPFTCILSGPTGCGKTHFARQLIKYAADLITPPPEHILWIYDNDDPESTAGIPKYVELTKDVDSINLLSADKRHLVIVDDKMMDDETAEKMEQLFTRGSHHRNLSVVYIIQNLFNKHKRHRTISVNTHYLVIFKNPRDRTQIEVLARQTHPGNSKFVLESYNKATAKPYGYLLLDLHQKTDDAIRLRTDIFDYPQVVFIPNNK